MAISSTNSSYRELDKNGISKRRTAVEYMNAYSGLGLWELCKCSKIKSIHMYFATLGKAVAIVDSIGETPVDSESLQKGRFNYLVWVTVFTPRMVETYGRDNLLSAPAWRTYEWTTVLSFWSRSYDDAKNAIEEETNSIKKVDC